MGPPEATSTGGGSACGTTAQRSPQTSACSRPPSQCELWPWIVSVGRAPARCHQKSYSLPTRDNNSQRSHEAGVLGSYTGILLRQFNSQVSAWHGKLKQQGACLQSVDAWFLVIRRGPDDRLITGPHLLHSNALHSPQPRDVSTSGTDQELKPISPVLSA